MEMLSSLGNFISNDAKPLNALLSLAGAGTNLFSGVKQVQEQNRLQGAQKYVTDLVTNPSKMTAARAAYTQPLNAGLTEGITNQVQASLAERGLGSSPAAFTQQLTQALAPYIMNNQNLGMQDLLTSLGLTTSLHNTAPAFADISKLLAQLKMPSSSSSSAPVFNLSSLSGSADPLSLVEPTPVNLPGEYDLSAIEEAEAA